MSWSSISASSSGDVDCADAMLPIKEYPQVSGEKITQMVSVLYQEDLWFGTVLKTLALI